MASAAKPIVLLVHGAWHGAWCWDYLIPELKALGYDTETLDLPSTTSTPGKTQFDDADHVRGCLQTLLAAGKQVVILAHSYGGQIASAALVGLEPSSKASTDHTGRVVGFIMLCGFVLPGGMDQGAGIRERGGLLNAVWDTPSKGLWTGTDLRRMLFAPDVSEELTDWAMAKLGPQSMASTVGIVPPQAWQGDGFKGFIGYIKATADQILPVARQEKMIEAAGGEGAWIVRALEGSSHSPQMSRPREVAGAVESIVQKFETNGSKSA